MLNVHDLLSTYIFSGLPLYFVKRQNKGSGSTVRYLVISVGSWAPETK